MAKQPLKKSAKKPKKFVKEHTIYRAPQKGKKPRKKFPKIYRVITDFPGFQGIRAFYAELARLDKWLWSLKISGLGKILIFSFLTIVLLLSILAVGLDLQANVQKKQQVEEERVRLKEEITYWESVIAKYKDYRDGYFQLAVLYYQLKDKKMAYFYLQKALALDPYFEKGRELEERLNN